MLVLSRKLLERIQIGENVVITILEIRGKTVRLGIQAPRQIHVKRAELQDSIAKPPSGVGAVVVASLEPQALTLYHGPAESFSEL